MSEPLSVISSGSTGKPTLAPHEQVEAQATLDELRASAIATAGERPIRIQAVTYNGDAPAPGSWIVHFMRHGIGEHNVWGAEWAKAGKPGNAYSDPLCPEDAHLTPLGRRQAAQAQPTLAAHLGAVATAASPALVYVSPLRRAMETALEATRGLPVRLVAHEGLHEQGGLHHCDRRLTKTELAAQFPAVDFALVEHEHDPTWDADAREPSARVLARAYAFLLWLQQQCSETENGAAAAAAATAGGVGATPRRHVAVVAHSAVLLHLFNGVLDCGADPALREWFRTGELRSVVLTL